MRKVTTSFEIPHTIEQVGALMCDPDFNEERDQLRDGVISSTFHLVRESESEVVFELRATEYKRKKTGGLDKSGTVQTVSHHRYVVEQHRMTWDYRGVGGERIELGGVYHINALGDDRTRFTHEVTVEVKVPIVGKLIERLIAQSFETPDPRYQELWERHISKSLATQHQEL